MAMVGTGTKSSPSPSSVLLESLLTTRPSRTRTQAPTPGCMGRAPAAARARSQSSPIRALLARGICDIVAERSKARGSGPRLARGVGSNPTDVILFSCAFGRGLPFARSLSLSHHRLHPPLSSAVIPTSSPKQPGAPTFSWTFP
eukprot:scaffold45105_cov67-Phaeocystis_antarctica.AAC.12